MKIKLTLFYKSFFLSLAIFALVSGIILTSLYMDKISVDPTGKESNLLVGVTHNGEIVSLSVINCNPENKSINFLSIPDNTLLADGRVLQALYQKNNLSPLKSTIEDLIGAKIDRYILFNAESISTLTNTIGSFDYLILYPFMYNNHEHLGFSYMYGELAYEMFTYEKYDMTKVSMASIGDSYLRSFLTAHANPLTAGKIAQAISSFEISSNINTNLSNEEIVEYCNLFAKYSSFNHAIVNLEGQTHLTSSRLYFTPNSYHSDKNIFK